MTFKKNAKLNSKLGLTLIELVIVMALLGILMTGIMQLFVYSSGNWDRAQTQSRIFSEINVVLSTISREARGAQQPNDSKPAIGSATAVKFDLYAINVATGKMELIRYQLSNGELRRAAVAADETAYPYFWDETNKTALNVTIPAANWQTILTGITSTEIFTYKTNASTEIIAVRIQMSINDQEKPLENPIVIDTEYTIRSSFS